MTRWLTLILFSLGVLHAAGISQPTGAGDDCAILCATHKPTHEPAQAQPAPSCCPLGVAMAQAPADDYCPMSNGPCVCGITPDDAPAPSEPMPMPSRDRDTLQMTRAPPAPLVIIATDLPTPLNAIARTGSIRAPFSHNQAQALLGVWRR